MPLYIEILDYISKTLFCISTITNLFFIYLTIFHIKLITGTYKKMVITFSLLGVIFSGWELIAHPFIHNYNKAFMYFSLNGWLDVPQRYLQISLAIYAGLYTSLICFITMQFVFRYLTLVKPELAKYLEGVGCSVWILYVSICGFSFSIVLYVFLQPDDYSDEYLRKEIMNIYSFKITNVPRFFLIPYAADNTFRWSNLLFLAIGSTIIAFQYLIIIFCGVKMERHIRNELRNISHDHRRLERQFFAALIVQIVLPTCIFFLPAFPLLLLPMLDIEVSLQSGAAYSIYSLYSPLDSICFVIIVSEYRMVLKGEGVLEELSKMKFKTGIGRCSLMTWHL